MSADFHIKPEYYSLIQWRRRTHCDEPGCKDFTCACSMCGQPIGVAETDPRWDAHDDCCTDCDLCRDQVPLILFRGKGKRMDAARFHIACFQKITFFRKGIGA